MRVLLASQQIPRFNIISLSFPNLECLLVTSPDLLTYLGCSMRGGGRRPDPLFVIWRSPPISRRHYPEALPCVQDLRQGQPATLSAGGAGGRSSIIPTVQVQASACSRSTRAQAASVVEWLLYLFFFFFDEQSIYNRSRIENSQTSWLVLPPFALVIDGRLCEYVHAHCCVGPRASLQEVMVM